MTIKQQFKTKFNKCLSDINESRDGCRKLLTELAVLENNYENSYKNILENKLFINSDDVLFFVESVYVDRSCYDNQNMPIVMSNTFVLDYAASYRYKSSLLNGPITTWYEDSAGKRVVHEVKCDNIAKSIIKQLVIDSYENKIKLKRKKFR